MTDLAAWQTHSPKDATPLSEDVAYSWGRCEHPDDLHGFITDGHWIGV